METITNLLFCCPHESWSLRLLYRGLKSFYQGLGVAVTLVISVSFTLCEAQQPKGPLSGALINGADQKYNTPIAAMNHLTLGIDQIGNNELWGARQNFIWILNLKDDAPAMGPVNLKPLAHLNLGVVEMLEDNLTGALKNFQAAIDLKPDYAEAYFNAGTVHYKMGAQKKAEQAFQKAIELEPNYGRAHYSLGFLYFDMKRYDLAKQHSEKASENGVPFRTLRDRLARVGR